MYYCKNCGAQVNYGVDNFCTSCGARLHDERNTHHTEGTSTSGLGSNSRGFQDQMKSTFFHATEKINSMVGEEGGMQLNLNDVFSNVFKKHSTEEAELLFIAGTKDTTPRRKDIPTSWPKPWLFSRIFLIFAITYILLSVATFSFQNTNALPGLIMVGSFAVPLSLLIFFWEMNAPRNISLYEIGKMFFVGGASALVVTLFFYSIFPIYEPNFTGAILIGIFEEIGKFAIVFYFIRKLNSRFILNGLLIGATIGAGFAALESMGYALNFGGAFGDQALVSVMFLRAWTSIGTHVVWAAIAGAAFVYVKGKEHATSDHLFNMKFLRLFVVPIILHAVWDMPLYALQETYIIYIVLIVIAWIFVFTFIDAGLKQIGRLNEREATMGKAANE